MKKQVNVLPLFVLLLTFVSQLSFASVVSDEDVYRYLTLSGASKALANIPMQIEAMGQQMQLTAKDPVASQKIMTKIISNWQQNEIEKKVFDYVKTNITNAQMQPLLVWLETDLARRVKLAESQAAEPNFNQEIMHYLAELPNNPPPAIRVAAIRQFIESTRIVEQTLNMVMKIANGVTKALMIGANQEGNLEAEAKLKEQMEQMESMLKPTLEQQMIMVSYFIYRDINDEDFDKYSKFYQQELGQKELSLMYEAMGEAMTYWAATIVKIDQ